MAFKFARRTDDRFLEGSPFCEHEMARKSQAGKLIPASTMTQLPVQLDGRIKKGTTQAEPAGFVALTSGTAALPSRCAAHPACSGWG